MSNFFRSMGRSSRPKKSPTIPSMPYDAPNGPGSGSALGSGNKPLYLCNPFVRSALIKGSFKTIVVLPKYVDLKEWVAVNREWRCRAGEVRGGEGGETDECPSPSAQCLTFSTTSTSSTAS